MNNATYNQSNLTIKITKCVIPSFSSVVWSNPDGRHPRQVKSLQQRCLLRPGDQTKWWFDSHPKQLHKLHCKSCPKPEANHEPLKFFNLWLCLKIFLKLSSIKAQCTSVTSLACNCKLPIISFLFLIALENFEQVALTEKSLECVAEFKDGLFSCFYWKMLFSSFECWKNSWQCLRHR